MTADNADYADIRQAIPNIRAIREIRGSNHFMDELIHQDLSKEIIGAAMKVLNALRPGLDEKLYENALMIELAQRGHHIEQQKRFPVYYADQLIGSLQPDLIVNERVIVDPKVVTDFNDTHVAQMSGYLAITGLQLALLVNFKFARLAWKRVVRSRADELSGAMPRHLPS